MTLPKWIKSSEHVNDQILHLIESTFLGSRGARYKLLNSGERARKLDRPKCFYLERNEKVLGTITFCNRTHSSVSENYIRYFAFDPSLRAGKNEKFNTKPKNNLIRKQFGELLNQDVFHLNEKYCYYAFVDNQNYKSMQMAETFDFLKIGEFQTISFSRRKPKIRIKIEKLSGPLLNRYHQQLKEVYQNHNFFHPVNISKGDVYGIVENDEILIAATFHKTKWEIMSLPGKKGELKINILSKTPILKSFFRHKEFHFLGVEGILPNHPELVNKFFESVLNQLNLNVIMIWSDTKCPIIKTVEPNIKRGILSRFSKQENANIIVKHNLDPELLEKKPSYISSYDIS